MALPLKPPIEPQLAKSARELPRGDEWAYERKWDGFRAIAFVDGAEIYLQSRNGRPLRRYFPEIELPRGRHVIDGELVIPEGRGETSFNSLQARLHPAESRVRLLAEESPATFIAFDLLVSGGTALLERPFKKRRQALEKLAAKGLEVTKSTRDPRTATRWLHTGEGVVAKELSAPYVPGKRAGMVKVKRLRTADCVVIGWRPGKEEGTVGSLILGLYEGRKLREMGHVSGFPAKEKRELTKRLAPFETGERGSAEPSRWDSGRDLEWIGLRPELVVEVSFDHATDGRIRHGAKLLRWREDKKPKECLFEQLDS